VVRCLPRCMVLDVVKPVRRVIRIRRSGELLDDMNDVRIAQHDNHTSQRSIISQAHNMTVVSTEVNSTRSCIEDVQVRYY
jgi:hypothetical protein